MLVICLFNALLNAYGYLEWPIPNIPNACKPHSLFIRVDKPFVRRKFFGCGFDFMQFSLILNKIWFYQIKFVAIVVYFPNL